MVDGVTYKAEYRDFATGAWVTSFDQSTPTVAIADSVHMYDQDYEVRTIDEAVFQHSSIDDLTLGNNLETIGHSAFRGNPFGTLVIPDSVTSIANNAFYLNSITELTIGSGLTTINHGVFAFGNGYPGIDNLVIPDNIQSIGDEAFNNTDIRGLTLPAGLTSIDDWAFANTKAVGDLNIPDTVTTIGSSAFQNAGITSLSLGSGLTVINPWTFGANSGLTEVTIPDTISSIDSNAFASTSNLSSVRFEGEAPTTGTNPLGSTNGTTVRYHWRFGDHRTAGGFTSPTWRAYNSVAVATVSFDANDGTPAPDDQEVDVDGLSTATEPPSPTKSDHTFLGWFSDPGFTSPFDFNDAIEGDTELFARIALSDVSIEIGGVTYTARRDEIEAGATASEFDNSTTTVDIPDTITIDGQDYDVRTVGSRAFLNAGLTDLTLGENLDTIGESAFLNNNLDVLVIPDSDTSIGSSAFKEAGITDLTLGTGLTTVGAYSFRGNDLGALTIPDTMTNIDKGAFINAGITDLTLGTGLTRVGHSSFRGNDLRELTIPDNISDISGKTFEDNEALSTVTFQGSAPAISSDSFGGPTGKTLRFPWRFGDPQTASGYTTPSWNGYTTVALATITFDANGGTPEPDAQEVDVDGATTVTEPSDPSKPDQVLIGWHSDPGLGMPYDFADLVVGDLDLYAQFGTAPTVTGDPIAPATVGSPFTYAPTITGDPAPHITSSNTLPDGLSLDSETGVISGTPTGVPCEYPVSLTATSAAGAASHEFAIAMDSRTKTKPTVKKRKLVWTTTRRSGRTRATVTTGCASNPPTGQVRHFFVRKGFKNRKSVRKTLDSNGQAFLPTPKLAKGTWKARIKYFGDADHKMASVYYTIKVTK